MFELLTAEELAEKFKLRPSTIKQWQREGTIPCVRLSRRIIRFDPEQVLQVLRDDPNVRSANRGGPAK